MTTKQTIGYEEIIAYAQRILDGGEITPKEAEELIHVSRRRYNEFYWLWPIKIRQKNSAATKLTFVRLLTHVPANALKTVNSAPNRLITKQALPYIRL